MAPSPTADATRFCRAAVDTPTAGASVRYVATLVAIDQVTRATTPGKNPYPNMLPSAGPSRVVRNVIENDTAPMRATTPVQRASTPLRIVASPPAARNAAKPIGATWNGPTSPVAVALLTSAWARTPSALAPGQVTVAMVKLVIPIRPPA